MREILEVFTTKTSSPRKRKTHQERSTCTEVSLTHKYAWNDDVMSTSCDTCNASTLLRLTGATVRPDPQFDWSVFHPSSAQQCHVWTGSACGKPSSHALKCLYALYELVTWLVCNRTNYSGSEVARTWVNVTRTMWCCHTIQHVTPKTDKCHVSPLMTSLVRKSSTE